MNDNIKPIESGRVITPTTLPHERVDSWDHLDGDSKVHFNLKTQTYQAKPFQSKHPFGRLLSFLSGEISFKALLSSEETKIEAFNSTKKQIEDDLKHHLHDKYVAECGENYNPEIHSHIDTYISENLANLQEHELTGNKLKELKAQFKLPEEFPLASEQKLYTPDKSQLPSSQYSKVPIAKDQPKFTPTLPSDIRF
ncbi:MAG: hypothetical protein K2W97_01550 [Chthoniobacterales bacterium]|nr:hypothetical protein [Chthoniobacterales bacterium]